MFGNVSVVGLLSLKVFIFAEKEAFAFPPNINNSCLFVYSLYRKPTLALRYTAGSNLAVLNVLELGVFLLEG